MAPPSIPGHARPVPIATPAPALAPRGTITLAPTGSGIARSVREPGANGGVPSARGGTLTLVYNGERHPIAKDRFVIGRGRQSSDLTLKDPNVSRQHALVEFQNGVYFMVDMGSTNGVAFNGQRIARKPIAEGDVFRICDHDLLFTYQ
jgi:pSer/pThr/pTyr-binding forkhead associated (FHA) protein